MKFALIWFLVPPIGRCFSFLMGQGVTTPPSVALALYMKPLSREDEIRRKISQLKKQGKIKGSPAAGASNQLPSYEDKVKQKLGRKKSKLLGFENDSDEDESVNIIQAELDSMIEETDASLSNADCQEPRGRIGSIPDQPKKEGEEQTSEVAGSMASSSPKKQLIDPSLFVDTGAPEMSEQELIDLVVTKLSDKRKQESATEESSADVAIPPKNAKGASNDEKEKPAASGNQKKTTTGVGGAWIDDNGNTTEYYKPKSGSWGAFPRPKDISKTYGGGRRVGPGYSDEEDGAADIRTKRLLEGYRQKVGIDVPTEKEHATEIEEALQIAKLAMQRGVYATAVSALEKVTKWCSTNSKVGSKVFLELAMAYEAVGRTQEAFQVYQSLTTCRMEDVKYNARQLLYGLEAMQLMKDVSSDFSRTKIKNTFMDATGLGNIAQNFDDVYQTAYVDLDNGYYKRLTQSVVRSNREARQILLKATGKGEVGRMRVVQALRSIARHFDDALESEMESQKQVEPTAYLNGKPIVVRRTSTSKPAKAGISLDDFVLATPEQTIKNIDGAWKLQLLADKQGDGVSFFNTTTAMQQFSVSDMTFFASGPSGFVTMESSGQISMESARRVLSRTTVEMSGGAGGIFGLFGGNKNSGFLAAVSREQQIVSVDSVLLITKCAPGTRKGREAEKEHFGVWRRVAEDGM